MLGWLALALFTAAVSALQGLTVLAVVNLAVALFWAFRLGQENP